MAAHTPNVDVCAFLNQELHDIEVTILRSDVEAGFSIRS
jgi:hypothetical protein